MFFEGGSWLRRAPCPLFSRKPVCFKLLQIWCGMLSAVKNSIPLHTEFSYVRDVSSKLESTLFELSIDLFPMSSCIATR